MRLVNRRRHQKALYWPFDHYDIDGQPVVSSNRKEIWVRWVDERREVIDPQGNKVSTDATVIVDRDVAIGSIFWQGSECDIPGTGTGTGTDNIPESGFYQVISRGHTPDLRNRSTRKELGLIRFSNRLPVEGNEDA